MLLSKKHGLFPTPVSAGSGSTDPAQGSLSPKALRQDFRQYTKLTSESQPTLSPLDQLDRVKRFSLLTVVQEMDQIDK